MVYYIQQSALLQYSQPPTHGDCRIGRNCCRQEVLKDLCWAGLHCRHCRAAEGDLQPHRHVAEAAHDLAQDARIVCRAQRPRRYRQQARLHVDSLFESASPFRLTTASRCGTGSAARPRIHCHERANLSGFHIACWCYEWCLHALLFEVVPITALIHVSMHDCSTQAPVQLLSQRQQRSHEMLLALDLNLWYTNFMKCVL